MSEVADDAAAPVAYLYRWRVKQDKQAQFVQAWTRATEALREHGGSYGSRLHRGADGLWYAYALWPSREAREQAFAADLSPDNHALMQEAVEQALEEIELAPRADLLLPLPGALLSCAAPRRTHPGT